MMVLKINLNVYINNITSKNRCSPGWTGLRETPWRYDYDLMTILLPAFSSSSCPCSVPTLSFYSAIFRQNKASFYRFPPTSKLAMISTYCSLFPTIQPPTTSARRSSVYNRIKRGRRTTAYYTCSMGLTWTTRERWGGQGHGGFMRKLNGVEFLFSVPYPSLVLGLPGKDHGVINIHSCTNLPSPGEWNSFHPNNSNNIILHFDRKGNSINSNNVSGLCQFTPPLILVVITLLHLLSK